LEAVVFGEWGGVCGRAATYLERTVSNESIMAALVKDATHRYATKWSESGKSGV
jgi:hypothetical protein